MIIRVGLLSSNHEVIESVKASCTDFEFVKYKNADMVRAETDILLIDLDMFEESESVQFFISKIRKRFQRLSCQRNNVLWTYYEARHLSSPF